MPDRVSLQVNVTPTGPTYRPVAGTDGVAWPPICGAVLSIFTVTLPDAVLPATSVHVTLAFWLAPSLVSVREMLPCRGRDNGSVQVHVMFTSVLFQPNCVAGVRLLRVITGGVL